MKFSQLFVILFIFPFSDLIAQDRPAFLPEDIESTTLNLKCLCKPGVPNKSKGRGLEISFLHFTKSRLEEEKGFPLSEPFSELTLQQFMVKLKVPIINKEGIKFLLGGIYRPEHYDFKTVGIDYSPIFNYLNGRTLKSTGFDGILSKSWNEKLYSHFRFRAIYNGDYSGLINFDSQYAIYNLSGLLGVKKQENKEWGLGINFTHSFRNTIALPFFLFNQTFNDKWGIEMVLPAMINGRYNISTASILFLGVRYNSRSYAIDIDESAPLAYSFNHSEIRFALTLEQQIHPWIWADLTAGIQYNFSTDFDAANDFSTTFQVEPDTSPFFKIGVFISPPDSFLK